jgi:hypothetical protein
MKGELPQNEAFSFASICRRIFNPFAATGGPADSFEGNLGHGGNFDMGTFSHGEYKGDLPRPKSCFLRPPS